MARCAWTQEAAPCHPVTNTAIDHPVIENTRTAVAHASNCIHQTLQCTQSKLQSRSTTHTSLSRSPALQDRLPVYSNFFIECRFPAASSLHKPKSQHPCTNHDIAHHTPHHHIPRQLFSSHTRNGAVERSVPAQLGRYVHAVPTDANTQVLGCARLCHKESDTGQIPGQIILTAQFATLRTDGRIGFVRFSSTPPTSPHSPSRNRFRLPFLAAPLI